MFSDWLLLFFVLVIIALLLGMGYYYYSLGVLKRRYRLEDDWSSRDLRRIREEGSITSGIGTSVLSSGSIQLSTNTGITSDEYDTSKNS